MEEYFSVAAEHLFGHCPLVLLGISVLYNQHPTGEATPCPAGGVTAGSS